MNSIECHLLYSLYREGSRESEERLLQLLPNEPLRTFYDLWFQDHDPLIGSLLQDRLDPMFILSVDNPDLFELSPVSLEDALALIPLALNCGYPISRNGDRGMLTIKTPFFHLAPSQISCYLGQQFGIRLVVEAFVRGCDPVDVVEWILGCPRLTSELEGTWPGYLALGLFNMGELELIARIAKATNKKEEILRILMLETIPDTDRHQVAEALTGWKMDLIPAKHYTTLYTIDRLLTLLKE